ncbi:MAG: tRNA uridine-5-carboxymethylaminomethyl(34) synthesis GTPase MnmE [Candidatus Hydrogenedentes bacterium]|nr:tRNA uridine-5-carboxymethylaminomethyl(34) synthesis GTPase MnmE [Candidatus Hydrogenedentota bacterium]
MVCKYVEDTIVAIATPMGEGAIGIVRLSGQSAIEIVSRIFISSRGRDIRDGRGRIFHGHISDGNEVLDEVLVHVMREPRTYTCEDVVEVNGHGGLGPLRAVLELTLAHGARLAAPGEFTKRAFLNGRIDLAQAEAVIDRVRAQTRAALQAANAAAGGTLSKSIYEIRDVVAQALSRAEAAVDFPEDDLPELLDEAWRQSLARVRRRIADLLNTADAGRLYREGAAVAIAGRPNVGKSSLFNALLRDARAIVTEHPGTTRDVIQEVISVSGIPVRLSDTAGLRDTDDDVERLGVEVARGTLQNADVILLVLDSSVPFVEADHTLAREMEALEVPVLLVLNKLDLDPRAAPPKWSAGCADICRVSAKTGEGLAALEERLGRLLLHGQVASLERGLVTRAHQCDSLRRAAASLDRVLENIEASPELLSIDLREALQSLGEITGETTPDDILKQIFSSFCIGK